MVLLISLERNQQLFNLSLSNERTSERPAGGQKRTDKIDIVVSAAYDYSDEMYEDYETNTLSKTKTWVNVFKS